MSKSSNEIKNEDYEEKVIIYLDILGIGSFTKEASDKDLIEIYQMLESLTTQLPIDQFINSSDDFEVDMDQKRVKYHFSTLSDSIIISFSAKYLLLMTAFLSITKILQILLLDKGLLARGVVVLGKIYHQGNSSVIFGEGLVKAHAMDKSGYLPRITIDDELWNLYKRDFKENKIAFITKLQVKGNLELLSELISQDTEGYIIVNDDNSITYNPFHKARIIIENNLKSTVSSFTKTIDNSIYCQKDKLQKCNNDLKKRNLSEEEQKKKLQEKRGLENTVRYWEYTKEQFDKYVVNQV